MKIDILSLFPDYFKGPLGVSIIKRALDKGIIDIQLTDIRAFAGNKHKTVDDRPFGGGPGMVMAAKPVCAALRHVKKDNSHVVYLSPQGRVFDMDKARELAGYEHLIFLCGHYEGIDERALKEVDEEVSIGDFVLTNGCIAALVVLDAALRFVPGVLGKVESAELDSFCDNMLKGPVYTRPQNFEGEKVPAVLLNGNHAEIEQYRRAVSLEKTMKIRPDLIKKVTN